MEYCRGAMAACNLFGDSVVMNCAHSLLYSKKFLQSHSKRLKHYSSARRIEAMSNDYRQESKSQTDHMIQTQVQKSELQVEKHLKPSSFTAIYHFRLNFFDIYMFTVCLGTWNTKLLL